MKQVKKLLSFAILLFIFALAASNAAQALTCDPENPKCGREEIFTRSDAARAQSSTKDDSRQWFKADLHTHHTYQNPLKDEIAKYREAGYHFLVLSTKDMQTPKDVEKYSTAEMMIVSGVEQSFLSRKNRLAHVLGFRIKNPYRFTDTWSLKEGYVKLRAKNKDIVLGINHPHDQRWSLEDVLEAADEGVILFELNSISMKHGEFETALWDEALTRGARLYATLTNDVHQISDIDAYGYIMIHSASLDLETIAKSLHTGDFYAEESGCTATPVRYAIVETDGGKSLVIETEGAAKIRVIADNGAMRGSYEGNNALYPIAGDETYIRAEILDSQGRYVFLQPFFLK
ncbi:MAG: hypothetical protein AB1546_03880 [bacterium]